MYLLGVLYIPTWIAWIFMVLVLLFGYTFYKQTTFWRLGIKGPRPIPFFGNLGLISKIGMFHLDPQLMRKYGTVVGTYYGNVPTLIVSDPEMIKEICVKQFSKFYNRAQPLKMSKSWLCSVNNARDTQWKFLRAVIQPAFSFGKMRTMRPIFASCIEDFVSVLGEKMSATDDGVVDIYPLFQNLTMDVICRTAFGIEVNSQKNPNDKFVEHASKILGQGVTDPYIMIQFLFPDIRDIILFFLGSNHIDTESMDFLEKVVTRVMNDRRDKNSHYNDLLKLMMDTQKGEHAENAARTTFQQYKETGMTNEEILMNGLIFLGAGYDTTSTLLAWLSFCLATNPDCQEKLVDEIHLCVGTGINELSYDQIMKMEYLDMCVCETLRLYSPATRYDREAASNVTINGLRIPKGTHVTVSMPAVHRNPEYWPNPDTFDPERFSQENKSTIVPYSWIPFGAGPRNCVGMKLALVEVKMTIVRLLQNVRLSASPKLKIPPVVDKNIITKPMDGVCLTMEKRDMTP